MPLPAAVYLPRHPQYSDYYHCVEDYFETLVQGYDERFSRQYGFWRPYIANVIFRYLDCGDLQHGFARVKCKDCGHEYLLAFSCNIADKPLHDTIGACPRPDRGATRNTSGMNTSTLKGTEGQNTLDIQARLAYTPFQ